MITARGEPKGRRARTAGTLHPRRGPGAPRTAGERRGVLGRERHVERSERGDGRRDARRRPELRHRRHGRLAREGDAAHGPGRDLQRLARQGGRPLRGRARGPEVLRRRRHPARAGLAEPRDERAGTRHLVAGRQRLGRHRQPEGRAHDGAGRAVVHADAARHRHAQADGRRARLPGHADRLRRHRRPRQRSRGLGQVRPSRVGPVQAGQDQPELLHQRAQLHGGRVLRGDRQDERAHRRGPQPPGRRRLREERGERRRPLRRHHRDVPQQLVPGRRPRHRAHVRVGGRRRGEVHPRLQLGQPRRGARRRASRRGSRRCRSSPSTRRRGRCTPTAPSSCSTRTG